MRTNTNTDQERRENIRKEILFQLYELRPIALSASTVARQANKAGLRFVTDEVHREMVFLKDEGLIFEIPCKGTTDFLYRIHAEGVRTYEQNYAN
jgi:hypothetical protein